MRILFVCLGNICRSPTAEAVMRARLAERGLAADVEVDSAGTGSWHVGNPPDERATDAGARRGIELTGRARTVAPEDFHEFDLIVAMDDDNHAELGRLAAAAAGAAELRLLREFDPEAVARGELTVPDPYYGGVDGFDHVLDVVDRACAGLIEAIVAGEVGGADRIGGDGNP
jgi:protein-tyrosine phosphatase